MFGTKNEKKFEKVPQVEIDDKLYHESAEVLFSVVVEKIPSEVNGNKRVKLLYKLKKCVVMRGKVVNETIVRTEEGLGGREIIKKQCAIEVRDELKRNEGDL